MTMTVMMMVVAMMRPHARGAPGRLLAHGAAQLPHVARAQRARRRVVRQRVGHVEQHQRHPLRAPEGHQGASDH